jgi:hypothetical protein
LANWPSTAQVIDPDGGQGDYQTLSAFEAAYDGETPVTTDLTAQIRGIPADTGAVSWAGWAAGQDATKKIIIEAYSGSECDGTEGSGDDAILADDQDVNEGTNPMFMDWVSLEFAIANLNLGLDGGGTIRLGKCLFHDQSGQHGIFMSGNAAAFTLYVGGCLLRDGSHEAISHNDSDVVATEVYNCTIYNQARHGIWEVAGAMKCRNTAIGGSASNDFNSISDEDYCVSDDATAVGANSTNNMTPTDAWTNPAGDDFTIKDTISDLHYNQTPGVDQPSWFDDITGGVDFAGTAWDASNHSIGCFEYTAAGVTIEININDTVTITENVDPTIKALNIDVNDTVTVQEALD